MGNKNLKVCNLYSGIGGNRKLWEDVEVTAVEIKEEIAKFYKIQYANDKVIIDDAKEFLRLWFALYDFIWLSPPCQKNSRARFWSKKTSDPVYPDLEIYQFWIFLKHHFKGKFVIENTIPYYEPLIQPTKIIGRHAFWSNFPIGEFNHPEGFPKDNISTLQAFHGVVVGDWNFGQRKDQILRNCVHPETGLYILNCARNIITKQNEKQIEIF